VIAARSLQLPAALACAALFAAPPVISFAQSQPSSIVGAWTLNKDLSDQPPTGEQGSGENGSGRRDGGGYGGRGGFGGGMRGGRRGGMGGMGGGSNMSPEDAQRMRQAMRDELTAPDQLTIVQSDAMILMTSQDGRTVRLSPDGKKIKDDNTKIERKTKWDGDKLVSEVKGLGRGTITESYRVDPETHRLTVTIQMPGRNGQERTLNRVYDPAAKEGGVN
jgi:hypothetical protein